MTKNNPVPTGAVSMGQSKVVTLGRYLDKLNLSVYGSPLESVVSELNSRRQELWETGSTAPYTVSTSVLESDLNFRLQDYGGDGYRFHLDGEGVNVGFCKQDVSPDLRITFKPSLLCDLEGSLQKLGILSEEVAAAFLHSPSITKVSRCDYAVDFQCEGFEIPLPQDDAVCRVSKWDFKICTSSSSYGSIRTVGNPKKINFTMYDKTAETKNKAKHWMHDLWSQHQDYDDSLTVWRAEFRFGREFVNDFRKPDDPSGRGIDTLRDLEEARGDLLHYAVGHEGQDTGAWLRFCTPESRETRNSNRPIAPFWQTIAHEFREGTCPAGRKRIGAVSSYSPEHTLQMSSVYAAKIAAEIYLASDEIPAFEDSVAWISQKEVSSLLASKGISWEQAVEAEAYKLKQKGYSPNTEAGLAA